MPKLRRRAKKMMKVKHKKIMPLKRLDSVWNSYVEYDLIPTLLKTGKCQIDKYTTLEIVGQRTETNSRYMALLSKGAAITRTGRFITPEINRNRQDYTYKIVLTDTNYKGQVIFEPTKELSKKVRYALENTQTYYRLIN